MSEEPVRPAGQARRTNAFAIVSLVAAIATFAGFEIIGSVTAVVTGHIARRQIKETGETGKRIALIGLILGYVQLVLTLWYPVFALVFRSWWFVSGNG